MTDEEWLIETTERLGKLIADPDLTFVTRAYVTKDGAEIRNDEAKKSLRQLYLNAPKEARFAVVAVNDFVVVIDLHSAEIIQTPPFIKVGKVRAFRSVDAAIAATVMGYDYFMGLTDSRGYWDARVNRLQLIGEEKEFIGYS